jgi:hypothetical protein
VDLDSADGLQELESFLRDNHYPVDERLRSRGLEPGRQDCPDDLTFVIRMETLLEGVLDLCRIQGGDTGELTDMLNALRLQRSALEGSEPRAQEEADEMFDALLWREKQRYGSLAGQES